MTLVWIIVAVIITYLVVKNSQSSKSPNIHHVHDVNDEEEERVIKITEEMVFKAQSRFETKLRDETEFPDAISGDEIYIYRNLMHGWFAKLAAKNRYDEELTQKLRRDWLDYMEAVGDRSTYNYLWLESQDEEKGEKYRADHITASRKMFAIQDAFATAIGEEAVAELAKIQAMDFTEFSRQGELAPEGFEWDLGRRELQPVKAKKK